ncbi:hypothetical protein [Mammaliicoccus fleurettii]|uniref:hypothetical protein n=1 Tax=Mammaliicoccus fleurettii TaxID=150056 RepID=UPI0013015F08|nr:hypothetical protein [Mammaliicoccus fleurettii]
MATKEQKLQVIKYLKSEAHDLRDLYVDVSIEKYIQEVHDSMIAVIDELEADTNEG